MKYTAGLIRIHPDLSTTYANARPATSPTAVPTPPMTAPCRRKIRATAGDVSPIARRMPISRVLSATTMVRVPTMLNAATTMMKKIISPMASFSSWSALKRLAFWVCQSSERYG